MALRLKPLDQQVIVITGATSGIGLATARAGADRGAKLVLAARNGEALDALIEEMRAQGCDAIAVTADVSREADVRRIGEAAEDAFGRIDSWINNAAVALYGESPEVSMEDQRRLFDVDFWGVVHGAREALRRIKGPGAIINMGSILSDAPMPLQGAYTAAKHAVKGYTDTLRIEVEKARRPISVTLIKPASIDTPYMDHARTYREKAPVTPPPRYAPEIVAEAILSACEKPIRETYVGGAAAGMAALRRTALKAYDWYARKFLYQQQESERPAREPEAMRDNLYEPRSDLETYSRTRHNRHKTSGYTRRRLASGPRLGGPAAIAAALLVGIGVAGAAQRGGGGPHKQRGNNGGLFRKREASTEWPNLQAWSISRAALRTEPPLSAGIDSQAAT